MADPTIKRTPTFVVVYWHCLGYLDTKDAKRMRVADVAKAVGKRERRVGAALRWLVAHGYLIRGPKVADRPTYRLAETRVPMVRRPVLPAGVA